MRSIQLIALIVAVSVVAHAETITLPDGRTFADAKIISETPMRVTIRHNGGFSQVDKSALPEAIKAKYPPDLVAAERESEREAARLAAAAVEYERTRPAREARAAQLARAREESARHREQEEANERSRADNSESALYALAERAAKNYFHTQWRPGNEAVHITTVRVTIDSVEPVAGWPGQYNVTGIGYIAYYMSYGNSFSSNRNLRFSGVIEKGRMTVTVR